MDSCDIARQTLLEQQLLTNITHAIRQILAWEPHGHDQSRKLHSLRFITASLSRHLDHLMDLEEHDGYMTAAVESSPNLSGKINSLRHQHDQFRSTVKQLLPALEHTQDEDVTALEHICNELGDLLSLLDEHTRREADVLQEALLRDEGGEG